MRTKSFLATLGMLCLLLLVAGCNLQAGGAGPRTWIDAPLDGSTVELGPVVVRSHAASEGGTAQAALLVNGAQVRVDSAVDGSGALIEFAQVWTPQGPGEYLLQVISTDHAGNEGRSNVVRLVVGGQPAVATTAVPVTGTPATATITPTFTATGASGPTFTFNVPANCREGPSQAYEVVTAFLSGQQVAIEGRNPDSSWFWVPVPGGGHCWVSGTTGVPQGPYGQTAVVQPPAPPIITTEVPPPAATTEVPLSPPAAPGNFNVQELVCSSEAYTVRLSWQNVQGEDGYRIYRDGALINTLAANAQSYDDASPDYNSHAYRTEAFNASGTASSAVKNSTGCVY
ncbi:MAG: SH3 domain-containing protein [Chloroflexota bacterium]